PGAGAYFEYPAPGSILYFSRRSSQATVIAAIGKHPEVFKGKRVGALISGGNIDPAGWVTLTEQLGNS
ncbi:hypothetical protein ACFL1V_02735, partial [Pseudomonadota bacterium]